ncbi:hypothetical protein FGADI_9983 [Fusarium gaditjirri]|uniref:Uncharacterized protein n=1 Tax=Fusarium gaditjirri TaxID=282569 RepID=A0A8H4WRD0_9HYPO|nr:hypothetical protein FGADI_9983 [Fusarium gaditjirri]
MPLPESDEEIMARWSPQEWKFHAWEEKNSEKILDTQNRDAEWDAHNMDKVERLSRNICVYPKPFVAVGETNFGHVFSGYAFTPMTDFLAPKYPDSDSDVLGNMILAFNIHLPHSPPLSPGSSVHSFDADKSSDITRENTPDSAAPNVEFQTLLGKRLGFSNGPSSVFNAIHRKDGHLMATIPSAMEKMHAHISATCKSGPQNFVFAQLLLWSFTGDWKKAGQGNPNDDKRGRWNPNGFAVVVRLSPKGEPGKVYALRYPDAVPQLEKIEDDPIESRKPRVDKKRTHKRGFILKHYNPGHPHPKSDSSFWITKIADSIQELGSYKRKFEFDVISSNEPPIVNAKIWIYGLEGPVLIPVRVPDEIDT